MPMAPSQGERKCASPMDSGRFRGFTPYKTAEICRLLFSAMPEFLAKRFANCNQLCILHCRVGIVPRNLRFALTPREFWGQRCSPNRSSMALA